MVDQDNSNETIGLGSTVTLHFSLTLTDGTVAESSFEDEPMQFVVGDGTMIEGLETLLFGLKAGERKRVTINPDDAFGKPLEENVHAMPRSDFSPEIELEPGLVIAFTTPSGEDVPGTILEVGEDEVIVDFNHPLAGHELIFEFEIIDVMPPGEQLH